MSDFEPVALRAACDGSALLLDGKLVSQSVLEKVARAAHSLTARTGVRPGLAVVLVGADPASQVYVRAKGKAAQTCGFHSVQHDLPASTTQADLLALVAALNADPAIHGILVQMPLPTHIRPGPVLEAVSPAKDVDGFHPLNVGLLALGEMDRAMIPCTPAGCMVLLDCAASALGLELAGKNAVIVGRSNIVGKPMAQLLLSRHCTVTTAHSRTVDLASFVAGADILIAAVGKPEMIRGDWIKPGAIVIDVGINRVAGEGLDSRSLPRTRLVGDVEFSGAQKIAAAITPVPGGVGPMTIAMLMANTLAAATRAK